MNAHGRRVLRRAEARDLARFKKWLKAIPPIGRFAEAGLAAAEAMMSFGSSLERDASVIPTRTIHGLDIGSADGDHTGWVVAVFDGRHWRWQRHRNNQGQFAPLNSADGDPIAEDERIRAQRAKVDELLAEFEPEL